MISLPLCSSDDSVIDLGQFSTRIEFPNSRLSDARYLHNQVMATLCCDRGFLAGIKLAIAMDTELS